MEYVSGLTDPLTRPGLRFVGRHHVHDERPPAAMMGRRLERISEIRISPTLAEGDFAFDVERWDVMSGPQPVSHFVSYGLSRSSSTCGGLRGWEQFARPEE
jgi:hypothetical protein